MQKGMHEQLDVHELGSTVPMVAPLPKYTKMDKDNNTTNVDIHRCMDNVRTRPTDGGIVLTRTCRLGLRDVY